jgi:hypothetical protein
MKTILIITVLEVFVATLLLVIWRFRGAQSKTPATVAQLIIPVGDNLSAEFLRRTAVDDSRWSFVNSWKVAPQGDDRTPMHGDAARDECSSSAGRSVARRRHQAMYKEWSQHRHD